MYEETAMHKLRTKLEELTNTYVGHVVALSISKKNLQGTDMKEFCAKIDGRIDGYNHAIDDIRKILEG